MSDIVGQTLSWLLNRTKKKEFSLCGQCYGDRRGECIRINRCMKGIKP